MESGAGTHEAVVTAAADPTPRARVLLVDDDPAILDLFSAVLDKGGVEVMVADSFERATEIVEFAGRSFDVLIVDVALKDGWGSSLALRLKERLPEMGVIYISGYAATDPVLREAVEDHMVFLSKPFSAQQLLSAVRSLSGAL